MLFEAPLALVITSGCGCCCD